MKNYFSFLIMLTFISKSFSESYFMIYTVKAEFKGLKYNSADNYTTNNDAPKPYLFLIRAGFIETKQNQNGADEKHYQEYVCLFSYKEIDFTNKLTYVDTDPDMNDPFKIQGKEPKKWSSEELGIHTTNSRVVDDNYSIRYNMEREQDDFFNGNQNFVELNFDIPLLDSDGTTKESEYKVKLTEHYSISTKHDNAVANSPAAKISGFMKYRFLGDLYVEISTDDNLKQYDLIDLNKIPDHVKNFGNFVNQGYSNYIKGYDSGNDSETELVDKKKK